MFPIRSLPGIHEVTRVDSEKRASIKISIDRATSEDSAKSGKSKVIAHSEQSKDRTASGESENGTSQETEKDETVRYKGENQEISDDIRIFDHFEGKFHPSTTALVRNL